MLTATIPEVHVIHTHRPCASATLVGVACAAICVAAGTVFGLSAPSALDRLAAVPSLVGSAVHVAHGANGKIYLPLLSKGHPLAVCRGGMDEAAAVEHARGESCMMGICGPSGEGDAEVIAALRMTAEEHDVRYPEDGSLLEDMFPVGPPWICYWRIELRGDGVLRAGPPGSGPIRINRSMELFPAETCDDCVGGMGSYWWEDEGTPGAEATGTVDVPTGTATLAGPRPPSSPTATARAWVTPTP